MNYPYIQLYVRDYLSDPKLSLCCAATRGVWMDFLCVMHMNDRCGVITGTRDQLARLGRCSAVEVSTAIDELKHTETADVTERNGIVTLVCRRMKRESDARKQGRLRVQRHREHASVTAEETQKPLLVCGTGTDSSVDGELEGKRSAELVYAEYPRKVARPDALRAIEKALKKVGFSDLLEKTKAFAKAVEQHPRGWIPHPATWFNRESYNDDPKEWNPDKTNGNIDKPNARNFGITGDADARTRRVVETVARRQREAAEAAANGLAAAQP